MNKKHNICVYNFFSLSAFTENRLHPFKSRMKVMPEVSEETQ